MKIMAFYDFYTDQVRPLKLIIQAPSVGFNWSQILYVPLSAPFHPIEPTEFPDLTAASVLISDMVRRSNNNELGINLPQILERCGTEVELLYMEMDDVEEILHAAL